MYRSALSLDNHRGTEYIELGDYDFVDASNASGNTFTQWATLKRDEFYMNRPIRLNSSLKDAGNSSGTNGQVLVSTGSQVDWVDASTVGGSVDNYADSLSFSGGTLTLGRTGSLSDLTASIPLSGITGDFTDLDDTPNNYSGDANKVVVVNSSANGLTFATSSSVGTDTNYYLTGLSFNTGNGVLTATVNGATNPTVDLDGRYVLQSTGGNSGVPSGVIVMWSGSISSIPSGWVLCNGSNSTPDLRNKFVVGAWSDGANSAWPNLAPGHTGGSEDATLVSHSHTINNHTHSFSDNFSGTTSYKSLTGSVRRISEGYNSQGYTTGVFTKTSDGNNDITGSNSNSPVSGFSMDASHDHTFSGSVSGNTGNPSNRGTDTQGSSANDANLPPYYALAYIMKT